MNKVKDHKQVCNISAGLIDDVQMNFHAYIFFLNKSKCSD